MDKTQDNAPRAACTPASDGSVCQLNGPMKQCCCTCIYHMPVHFHCCTEPKPCEPKGECVCGVQKGWACVCLPMSDDNGKTLAGVRVYDNWPEHSVGCELHTPNDRSQTR